MISEISDNLKKTTAHFKLLPTGNFENLPEKQVPRFPKFALNLPSVLA